MVVPVLILIVVVVVLILVVVVLVLVLIMVVVVLVLVVVVLVLVLIMVVVVLVLVVVVPVLVLIMVVVVPVLILVVIVVVLVLVVVVLVVVIVVVFVAYHHFRVVMMMAGNTVVRIEATHRDTDETIAPEPTAADRVRLAVKRAVLEDLTHRQFTVFLVVVVVVVVILVVVLLPHPKLGGTRNLVVFRSAAHRIEVPSEIVVTAVERNQAAAGVRDGIPLQLEHALEPVVRSKLRNSIGDDVDDSANRSAAVEQTRGSAENLDLFGHERIDAHRMVHTGRRDIHGVQSIFHRPHARTGEPANDRPGNARGEG